MRNGLYYRLESGGPDTNLQLYSLLAAGREWQSLKADFSLAREYAPYYHSRCCHVVMLCGASVAQLAGQNDPTPGKEKTSSPSAILTRLADKYKEVAALRKSLVVLNDRYDAVRHFGLSENNIGHDRVTEIDFNIAAESVATTSAFWKAMIQACADDPGLSIQLCNCD